MSQELKGHKAQTKRKSRALSVPPCPVCSTPLKCSLLHVKDEDAGSTELLLLLDCPTDDYHGTVTQKDINEILVAEVIKRLRTRR